MLHLLGIGVIAILYFAAGGTVGMHFHLIITQKLAKLEEPEPAEVGMAMLNFILIPCWLAIWNKRERERLCLNSPIQRTDNNTTKKTLLNPLKVPKHSQTWRNSNSVWWCCDKHSSVSQIPRFRGPKTKPDHSKNL